MDETQQLSGEMKNRNDYDSIADLYDIYADTDYDFEFFLGEIGDRDSRRNIKVLELTSGTGRLSIHLIEAGVNLTCVDISQGMLDVLLAKLQERNLSARVVCRDVCDMHFQSEFDLAIFPFQAFMEFVGRETQMAALASIHRALKPGGRFLCTLHNPPVRSRSVDGILRVVGQFPHGSDTLIVSGFEQGGNPVVTRHQFYECYDADGLLKRKRLLPMQFELITEQGFREMAEGIGFQVIDLHGNYDRGEFEPSSSPVMIWGLEK